MTENDRPRFLVMFNGLAATFSKEPSKPMLDGYWMGLADLPIEAVENACQRAIGTCKFMPVPVELRELAGVMAPADRAIKAWEAFVVASRRHGYYDSVDFDDKVINATVRNLGGWVEIDERREQEGKDTWVRKEFERVYLALMRSGIGEEAGAPLIGFTEKENVMNGFGGEVFPDGQPMIPPPVKIKTGLPPLGAARRIGREQQLLESTLPGKVE